MIPLPPTITLFPYTTLFRSPHTSRTERPRDRPVCTARARSRRRAQHRLSQRPRVRRLAVHQRLLDHRRGRSEEHTSELQSPCKLVCRLLLEKKNASEFSKSY